jgi:hypothetical protein
LEENPTHARFTQFGWKWIRAPPVVPGPRFGQSQHPTVLVRVTFLQRESPWPKPDHWNSITRFCWW